MGNYDDGLPDLHDDNPGWTWLQSEQRKRDTQAVKNAVDDTKHLTEASQARIRNNLHNHNMGGVEATYEIRRGDNDPTQILKGIKVLSDAEVIAEYLSETQNCAWYVVEYKLTHQTVAAFGV